MGSEMCIRDSFHVRVCAASSASLLNLFSSLAAASVLACVCRFCASSFAPRAPLGVVCSFAARSYALCQLCSRNANGRIVSRASLAELTTHLCSTRSCSARIFSAAISATECSIGYLCFRGLGYLRSSCCRFWWRCRVNGRPGAEKLSSSLGFPHRFPMS